MTAITVYTLGWHDVRAADGEEVTAQLHGRVFVDDFEIETASGVDVMTRGGDFVQADIHVTPSTVRIVPLDREAFESPNPHELETT
jgi:hypothetical protein